METTRLLLKIILSKVQIKHALHLFIQHTYTNDKHKRKTFQLDVKLFGV